MPGTAIPPAAELMDIPSDDVLEGENDMDAIPELVSVIDTADTAYIEGLTRDGNLVVRFEAIEDPTKFISSGLDSFLEDNATIANANHHFFGQEEAFEDLGEEKQEKINAGEIDDLETVDEQIEKQFDAWREEYNVSGEDVDNILRLEITF